jgi:hypothetical protein
MKVFLSWSGTKSRLVAEAMRDWLPNVIQAVQPWMSAEDIDKGARWSSDMATQLEQANVGLICVTATNVDSPWILFESGALSKTLARSFVCPYLLDLEPSDLSGPLVQFQAARATKEDTQKFIYTINHAMGEPLIESQRLDNSFNLWWPNLEETLQSIRNCDAQEISSIQVRADREILEEVLSLLRDIKREHRERTPNEEDLKLELEQQRLKFEYDLAYMELSRSYELRVVEQEVKFERKLRAVREGLGGEGQLNTDSDRKEST